MNSRASSVRLTFVKIKSDKVVYNYIQLSGSLNPIIIHYKQKHTFVLQKTAKGGATGRLTDTSKYTGT